MMRRHSVIAAVKEFLNIALGEAGNIQSKGLDVAKLGVIGEESTGKTTLAEMWCHLLHLYALKVYNIPFAVRMFGEEEFLNFKQTLASLEPTNHILYFRDLSFLQDKKALGNVKQAVTKIRHLPGGQDVKIILVYDYHYTLGLDKYLRQSHFKIFTSAGSSEAENIEKIFGNKQKSKIAEYQRLFNEMITKHKATFRIGPKSFFSYSQWNPFGIVLLWNGARARFIVSPSRPWIDKLCNTCTAGAQGVKSEMSIQEIVKHGSANFGPGNFEAAV